MTDLQTPVDLRGRCCGVTPLDARLEPWQQDLLGRPEWLADVVTEFGSPVNLIDPRPMARNASELAVAAQSLGIGLSIYFARKANKAIGLVDQARNLGLGLDVASHAELTQVLDRGVAPEKVIVTAAIKPRALLELAVSAGVTVSIDNADELELLTDLADRAGTRPPIALRLAPDLGAGRPLTRFGLSHAGALTAAASVDAETGPRVVGIHFHLDGYSALDRVQAIDQAFVLVDELTTAGHRLEFLDIGGGIPMSYLDSPEQWDAFWDHQQRALDHPRPLTYSDQPLNTVYPYYQSPVRGPWLESVLSAECTTGTSIARAIEQRGLELRCEPGRSLLDGCGMTVARVEFRKPRGDGSWLIGVAMNRTQCRSTSDDFMVDPILVRPPGREDDPEIDGYLVGAYCIERELLTVRRMTFPTGVQVGDLIAFPNTAGYLMHILESASHQMPLAKNVIVTDLQPPVLDLIDQPAQGAAPTATKADPSTVVSSGCGWITGNSQHDPP